MWYYLVAALSGVLFGYIFTTYVIIFFSIITLLIYSAVSVPSGGLESLPGFIVGVLGVTGNICMWTTHVLVSNPGGVGTFFETYIFR